MSGTLVPLFGPIPGGPEMIVILLIAILLFGANKIPKLARSTGEAMGEFKKGRQEVEQELQEIQEGVPGEGEEDEELLSEESSGTQSSGSSDTTETSGSSQS